MAISKISNRNYHSDGYVSQKDTNDIIKLPENIVLRYDFDNLREIAQRQINHYNRQVLYLPDKRPLYTGLINKLILHESLIEIFRFYNMLIKGVK